MKNLIDPDCSYIGESWPVLRVFEAIALRNKSPNRPVLLLGPSGAGKSEIAEFIHKSSPRKKSPYKRQQAAAFQTSDPSIARSQWTGIGSGHALANVPRGGQSGLLEQCDGGTIFIDELCALSSDFQTLLLDVLDHKPVTRVGGAAISLEVNVRLIVATNADPIELVKLGKIRHDLLNRLDLNAAVRIPPLNQHKEDIFPFIRRWVGERKVTNDFYLACLAYDWPGNVRELQQVIEQAMTIADSKSQLTSEHLNDGVFQDILALLRLLSDEEKENLLFQTLDGTLRSQGFAKGDGLQDRIGALLGVSAATVSRMAKRLGKTPHDVLP